MTLPDACRALLDGDKTLAEIRQKISSGSATYRDTFFYSSRAAELLGKLFAEKLPDISVEERQAVCMELLKDRYMDTNAIIDLVQAVIDSRLGLHLKPQRAPLNRERILQIGGSLEDTTKPIETLQRRARAATATAARAMHDDRMRAKAAFRGKAGLRCTITRETDGNCCPWCLAMAGRFRYEEAPSDIYRRHDNCECTVLFESGRELQDVHSKAIRCGNQSRADFRQQIKATHTARDAQKRQDALKAAQKQPKKLTRAEAEALQEQNLPKRLTNGGTGGIIKVERTTLFYKPNAVTEVTNRKGGKDRNYYDETGRQIKQLSNNDHGNPKKHPYGAHGEHAHDYVYDEHGNLLERPIRALTNEEREEMRDIL